MSIPARHATLGHTPMIAGGTLVAVLTRTLAGGSRVAQSIPAAVVFGTLMIAVAMAAGWRPALPRASALVTGLAGAAVVVALPAIVRGVPLTMHGGPPPRNWMIWAPALLIVVAGEELVLRGVLFDALHDRHGVTRAVVVTSIMFGLMHIPLYGWGAVPLDVAVGVWLAGLRLVTAGVAAPTVCHGAADAVTWWLP